ncbi:hypothetical protein AKJ62_00785 [candidate division MSBL1 archaeon SCGC-AAA259D14]|uniref:Uncharacterized protein n=1 Tax=candidate division MSBL1 archaeon SCGC-AAA259D14 TaxID=1698261 RepID=A0A133U8D6_9EURY|nr:hypothetical protein AKJ62_00785 [candidate division MSBL1 archaeon SCGC-AAA259D14]
MSRYRFDEGFIEEQDIDFSLAEKLADLVDEIKGENLDDHQQEVIERIASVIIRTVTDERKPKREKWTDKEYKKLGLKPGQKLRWMDHTAVLKDNILLSEPYQLPLGGVKDLVDLCESEELDMRIDGNSHHFPGRTFRIMLTESD